MLPEPYFSMFGLPLDGQRLKPYEPKGCIDEPLS